MAFRIQQDSLAQQLEFERRKYELFRGFGINLRTQFFGSGLLAQELAYEQMYAELSNKLQEKRLNREYVYSDEYVENLIHNAI